MTGYEGLRSEKITILIPKSLKDDLHALRLATMQSTGDLINELLEAHLASCPRDLADGRRLAEAEADRIRAREARKAGASVPQREGPAADPAAELPTMADLQVWIDQGTSEDKITRRRKEAEAFLAWLAAEGRTCKYGDADAYIEAVLSKKYSASTLRDHSQRVRQIEKYVLDSRLRCTSNHVEDITIITYDGF